MNFLSPDSTFGKMFNLIMELIVLNFLWVITSLPLITLGASTAALYDRCLKKLTGEDDGLIRAYFKSFAHHFRKGTGMLLIALAVGALIYFDLLAALQWDSFITLISLVVIVASLYFYLMVLSVAFPSLAYFDGKVFATIKQAFFLGLQGKLRTVLVMVLNIVPVLLFATMPELFIQISALWLCIGFAAIAYVNCGQLLAIFDPEKVKELKNNVD